MSAKGPCPVIVPRPIQSEADTIMINYCLASGWSAGQVVVHELQHFHQYIGAN